VARPESGWRSLGGRELRELDDGVDLLQLNRGKGVREVRRDGGGRLGGKGEHGAHRRWRILPGMPAGTAESGDRFRRFGGALSRKEKGVRRRTSGGFYRHS
jgi:hypothetical protein